MGVGLESSELAPQTKCARTSKALTRLPSTLDLVWALEDCKRRRRLNSASHLTIDLPTRSRRLEPSEDPSLMFPLYFSRVSSLKVVEEHAVPCVVERFDFRRSSFAEAWLKPRNNREDVAITNFQNSRIRNLLSCLLPPVCSHHFSLAAPKGLIINISPVSKRGITPSNVVLRLYSRLRA